MLKNTVSCESGSTSVEALLNTSVERPLSIQNLEYLLRPVFMYV